MMKGCVAGGYSRRADIRLCVIAAICRRLRELPATRAAPTTISSQAMRPQTPRELSWSAAMSVYSPNARTNISVWGFFLPRVRRCSSRSRYEKAIGVVERENLRHQQAAHDDIAERLVQFRSVPGERIIAAERRHGGHQNGSEAQRAGAIDRLLRIELFLPLDLACEVDQHDADDCDNGEIEMNRHRQQEGADAGRQRGRQNRNRMDRDLIEHAEDDERAAAISRVFACWRSAMAVNEISCAASVPSRIRVSCCGKKPFGMTALRSPVTATVPSMTRRVTKRRQSATLWQRSYNVSRPSKPPSTMFEGCARTSFGDKIVGQTYPPGFVLPRSSRMCVWHAPRQKAWALRCHRSSQARPAD
jgi:hypothetical protein